ncbi:MAG TPA: TadE/TadG family type IV pilus assembly protein [Marmoricola sp.]|nr:TadE/TadG family type IV pilus assembly protein [Marmoricola sp.]
MRFPRPLPGRVRRNESGAAAVEFALVTTLLFPLVLGIIAFGIVFAQELALGNAARQTARYGVVADRSCADIVAEARHASNTIMMKGTDTTVTVKVGKSPTAATNRCAGPVTAVPCSGSTTGDNIYVSVGYVSELIIPLGPVDHDFELQGDGVFRCEFS